MKSTTGRSPPRILILDIGGSHVKASFSDHPSRLRIVSGPTMTPGRMVRLLKPHLQGHVYDVVAIGYPGLVSQGQIVREPHNLGTGWVGFDFERAFARPTRVLNDAAMQALGSYRRGHSLFLGLGTGLGSAMVLDGRVQPMELAHLPYKKGRTFEDYVGEAALERYGRKRWEKEVHDVVEILVAALEPDDVVLGGGNVRRIKQLPPGTRAGNNRNAFVGGIRVWRDAAEWSELIGKSVPVKRTSPPPVRAARKSKRSGRR
ncbi:MAG: ROK family protein [Thermoplasmata archaeon]|nr:ROK family protein [Thermoplasmata archaeon]